MNLFIVHIFVIPSLSKHEKRCQMIVRLFCLLQCSRNSIGHLICNHFSGKVVLEKWFCKLGFFFLVNHFSRTRKKIQVCRNTFLQPEKMWIYGMNPPFFLVQPLFSNQKKIRVCRTTFVKPDFSNQIS